MLVGLTYFSVINRFIGRVSWLSINGISLEFKTISAFYIFTDCDRLN